MLLNALAQSFGLSCIASATVVPLIDNQRYYGEVPMCSGRATGVSAGGRGEQGHSTENSEEPDPVL
jgi:hypothetical protein